MRLKDYGDWAELQIMTSCNTVYKDYGHSSVSKCVKVRKKYLENENLYYALLVVRKHGFPKYTIKMNPSGARINFSIERFHYRPDANKSIVLKTINRVCKRDQILAKLIEIELEFSGEW